MKILMVCLGNICRSPLAEGIMRQKIVENNLNWEVDSAGTGYWHSGELPDKRSVAIAKQYGIDITNQRARQIKTQDLEKYNLIFAMDSSNLRDILRLTINETQRNKVHLMMNMAYVDENRNVPDPYYDDDGFENVFKMLEIACEKVIHKYK